jgi:hypothetical protein
MRLGMIKSLLTTTALLPVAFGAFAADLPVRTAPPAPVVAVENLSGYLGTYVGGTGMSWSNPSFLQSYTDYPKGNAVAIGAVGAVNRWLSNSVSLQISSEAEATSGYKSQDGNRESRFSGVTGAHLSYRETWSHAFGIFAGLTGLNSLGYNGSHNGGIVGFEAQKYVDALTLYAQAGYGDQFNTTNHSMLQKYWFTRGMTRYFIDPDLQLSAELGYSRGAASESGVKNPIDVVNWSLGLEHRLARSPLSMFASYQGDRSATRTAGCKRATVVQATLMVGVKINFGTGTLQANDRNGATFNLPKLHRSMALVDGLEDSSLCSVL